MLALVVFLSSAFAVASAPDGNTQVGDTVTDPNTGNQVIVVGVANGAVLLETGYSVNVSTSIGETVPVEDSQGNSTDYQIYSYTSAYGVDTQANLRREVQTTTTDADGNQITATSYEYAADPIPLIEETAFAAPAAPVGAVNPPQ